MMYYILTLIFLFFFLAYLYFSFIRVYYCDLSLAQFKELRHDSVMFLTRNFNTGIPLKELEDHAIFIEKVDATIKRFDRVKSEFSNIKSVKRIYSNIVFSSIQYREIKEENAKSLDEYKVRYLKSVMTLFKTIPFYRERVLLHLAIIILSILVKIGVYTLKDTLRKAERLYNIRNDIMSNNQCYN